MDSIRIDGIDLEYRVTGAGEPVVCIHGAFVADSFRPLENEPCLAGYRLVIYHRRGYGATSSQAGPLTAEDQAEDCLALMRHLKISRAHVVGHSFGGSMSLELARREPDAVHSLCLLEPALFVGAAAQSYRDALAASAARYRVEGASPVMDEFLRSRWPGFSQAALDRAVPGAYARALVDARAVFELDIGLTGWSFDEKAARGIDIPALVMLGGDSPKLHPRFEETYRSLLSWLPRAEGAVIPGATHFLQLEDPAMSRAVAEALANFLARHPM
jgi:pimeloyl-ACP methyl ester carboxylesterase